MDCPFCNPDSHLLWFENDIGIVLRDAYPITQGHTLVVPRKHVASIYELSDDIQVSVWSLVSEVRNKIDGADGFNIGFNDGLAAGQTILHAHIHVIPRIRGDTNDPRGGIRWIFPNKAKYW